MRKSLLGRTIPAFLCGLALATGAAAQTSGGGGVAPVADQGEPLPPGAPTDPYELTGWCYGALAEYLQIYDQVKPDLIAIDKLFGTPVKEAEPYQSDVKVYHDELKVFGEAIVAAEKASPRVISGRGAAAIRSGQGIWQQAETRSRRELAHAWLSWGMPDACDVNARKLLASASLLGKALKYNQGQAENAAPAASVAPAGPTSGQGGDNSDGGALVLAPIAPVVTHDAAAPAAPPPQPAMAGAQRIPDEAPVAATAAEPTPTATADQAAPPPAAVDTGEPQQTAAAAPPAPAPDTGAPVMASAGRPSRVVDDTPTMAAAAQPPAPDAAPAPVPPPVAAAEPQPAPATTPQGPAPATAARAAPTPAATGDEPQEPVL